MKIEISLDSVLERALALLACVCLALLCAAGILSLIEREAIAEWDSSSAFGDSYYLERIASSISECASELDDIGYTLGSIEDSL